MYFMLVAYAMENYLKAALVQRHARTWKPEVERSGKLPQALKNHDLVELAQQVGFTLDLPEEDLLRRLERCSVWFGRYPIPLNARDLGPRAFSDGQQYNLSWFGGNDLDSVQALLQRFRTSFG
ncbi:MAG: hypothetical protein H0X65_20025 [Gemmatimonadetes bacterium]|nr:hypothetical protein [Gemmatimonadota bacterium]